MTNLKWHEIFSQATYFPTVARLQELISEADVTTYTPYGWIGIGQLVNIPILIFAFGLDILTDPKDIELLTGSILVLFFFIITLPIIIMIRLFMFICYVSFTDWLARFAFNCEERYDQFTYISAAVLVPLNILSTLLSIKCGCFNLFLGFYEFDLQIKMLKAVYSLTTSQAVLLILMRGLALVGFIYVPIILTVFVFFLMAGPTVAEWFKQFQNLS